MRTLIALLCGIAMSAQAETFNAKVIMVMDGDTVMVLRGNQRIKVRMANIDAPEKDQAYGKESRESLQQMLGRKTVRIDSQAVDKYGRMVGTISLDGMDVNQEQLRRGMAWENSHFHSDRKFLGLQADAQKMRRGLWAQAVPQAPWEWRKLHPSTGPLSNPMQHRAPGATTPRTAYDAECKKKRLCSQMSSCDEARYYLAHCGVRTLDRNKDGIPCESLCSGKH